MTPVFTSIRAKLFLLSTIPLLIATVLITWHTVDTRRTEIETDLVMTAQLTVDNIARIADFALFSGRVDLLRPLATTTEKIPSIASVVFLDQNRDVLYSSHTSPQPTAENYRDGKYDALPDYLLVVERPVYLSETDVTDYEDPAGSGYTTRQLLGWVAITVDKTAMEEKSSNILFTHLLISSIILVGAVSVTYLLSNSVVHPIRAMTSAVGELEKGNLYTRIAPSNTRELAILAHGINHLAQTVAESRQNLQRKVFNATHQLQSTLEDLRRNNQALDNARRDAEAANQAKSDFLAQMSHELRTPISAIQGFVKLLEESNLNNAEKRYCSIIQQASLQLLQLIDDILDITRMQSSGITLDVAPFNLRDCIENPISLMAPTAHQKKLELILDIAPDIPAFLLGDSLRIRQIVYNLVSNAIKFTATGQVVVRLGAKPGSHRGEIRLSVHVIDTGIGIPEKHRSLIFEPFSQADNSISRRYGGTGLGLTIVKNLVQLMAGTIDVESRSGKGTTFSVELPLEIDTQNGTEKPQSQPLALLFDPVPESRQALEHLLVDFFDSIESCENMDDLEFTEFGLKHDLVIYSVPVSESIASATEILRFFVDHFRCPILVVSGLNSVQQHPLISSGPDTETVIYLDKPVSYRDIANLFRAKSRLPEAGKITANTLSAEVLIAEDNDFNRLLLTTYLERLGCQLTSVLNGQEAIRAADKQRFDLIFMDVHMPEVNGISAVKAIRLGHGPNRQTPIIMMTADILQQEENALFDAGASDLIFKPLDESRLSKALQDYVHIDFQSAGKAEKFADSIPSIDRTVFVAEVRKLTEQAKSAIDRRDAADLREYIHQLLGIAGVYKMAYLERAVRALHAATKAQDEEKTYAAMTTLEEEVGKLQASIDS